MKVFWHPIPEKEYDDALGCLPPRLHLSDGFLLGEPYSFRECTVTGKDAQTWTAFKIVGIHTHEKPCEFFRAGAPLTVAEFKREMGRPL